MGKPWVSRRFCHRSFSPSPPARRRAQILTFRAHFDEILTFRGIFPIEFSKIAQILTLRAHVWHFLPPNSRKSLKSLPYAHMFGQVAKALNLRMQASAPRGLVKGKIGPKIHNPKMYSQRECFGAPFLELISALACVQESPLDPPSRALALSQIPLCLLPRQ